MKPSFLNTLLDEATRPFKQGGQFAYHFARGKLGSDPIFREMLRRGLLPERGRLLDLGCGQGSLFGWLLAAQRLKERGQWPSDWAPAPGFQSLRGIELMQNDVDRAVAAFGADHPVVRVEQGDMNQADFGRVDVVTILDALHYFDHEQQALVLRRIRAALPPGRGCSSRASATPAQACRSTSPTGWTTRSPSCAGTVCRACIAAAWPNGKPCSAGSASRCLPSP